MIVFKNMKNRPLPIALRGRSISVGGRKEFSVEESEVSSELLRYERMKRIRREKPSDEQEKAVEQPVLVQEPTPPVEEVEEAVETAVADEESQAPPEVEGEISEIEKSDDSLTNDPESVELILDTDKDDTTDSGDGNQGKKTRRKSRRQTRR